MEDRLKELQRGKRDEEADPGDIELGLKGKEDISTGRE